MTANKYFNINRFKNILKRELHSSLKNDVLIIGAMFSVFTVIALLIFQFGDKPTEQKVLNNFHLWTFGVMFYVGGIFISTLSFIDLRSRMKAHFYLLTPSSTFEKFLANLLISLLAYSAFMIFSYFIYSHLFNWIVNALYDIQFKAIDFSNKDLLIAMQVFVFVHSVFYLGAVTFKKLPIILTPIATLFVVVFFQIIGEIVKRIVFPELDFNSQIGGVRAEDLFDFYKSFGKILVFYILPVVFWYISYLKLKEREF